MQTPTKVADSTTNARDRVAQVSPEGLPAPRQKEGISLARRLAAERIGAARQLTIAHWIIGLCCLPSPLLAIVASITQPNFVAAMQTRQALLNPDVVPYIGFIGFAVVLLLLAYHALMFWYNPFAADSDAMRRKRKIINGIVFFFSVPVVSGLILFSLGIKKNWAAILASLQALATDFPLQPWLPLLLVALLLYWLIWSGVTNGWFIRFALVQKVDAVVVRFWNWGRRMRSLFDAKGKAWRGRLYFFILTFVLFSMLLSEMVQVLGVGLGFVAGTVAGVIQLTLLLLILPVDIRPAAAAGDWLAAGRLVGDAMGSGRNHQGAAQCSRGCTCVASLCRTNRERAGPCLLYFQPGPVGQGLVVATEAGEAPYNHHFRPPRPSPTAAHGAPLG